MLGMHFNKHSGDRADSAGMGDSPSKTPSSRRDDGAVIGSAESRELRALREENARLQDAVRRAENAALAAGASGPSSPAKEQRERDALSRLEDRYQQRMKAVTDMENQLTADRARWQGDLASASERVRTLGERLDAATLELEVRGW
jgi:hypothetical protein